MDNQKEKKLNFGLIMAVYLLGIFMGALDTGIVTPARTVIQNALSVDDNTGVWMITIYTLAYAASIPVMGKLADRAGRKYVYLISIALFGTGSLFCGLAQGFDSFTALLIARAFQAIGGGGIMPVATAEFGTTFPVEKRGMALGLVGGVYGIANIFGASVGSAVLDIFGNSNWQYIFYINVPITVFILIAGFLTLPNTRDKSSKRIDGTGIAVLVVMILSLMYGLKNIDFFDFTTTLTNTNVYPFLIAFCVLLPVFIFVEKRAEDPVMNLSYFSNSRILITLILSVMTGVILMGLIFIPQFCENCMKVKTGSGGYFVIILGIFAGIGAPTSGKLTDKKGPKFVLGLGFLASVLGSLFVVFVTTAYPGWVTVIISLVLIGTGIGFIMGAPLNYMMLENTNEREANSALATLSLVRSIGTVIAPAIMVGFIAHAGLQMQGNIMKVLPDEINVPELPYAQELTASMKEQGITGMPDLTSMTTVKIEMSGSGSSKVPKALLQKMQSADVTTIVPATKEFVSAMFDEMTPSIESKITGGVDQGISGMKTAEAKMDKNISGLNEGISGIQQGITGMTTAITKQDAAIAKMKASRTSMQKGLAGIQSGIGFQKMMKGQFTAAYAVLSHMPLDSTKTLAEQLPAELSAKMSKPALSALQKMHSLNELTGATAGCDSAITSMQKKASDLQTAISGIDTGISKLETARDQIAAKRSSAAAEQAQMKKAVAGIESGKASIEDTISKMNTLKAAVPGAFRTAKADYMKKVDSRSDELQVVFQDTLNEGFRQIYITVATASVVGMILLMLYRKKKES